MGSSLSHVCKEMNLDSFFSENVYFSKVMSRFGVSKVVDSVHPD